MKKETTLFALCMLYYGSLFISFFPPASPLCLGLLAAFTLFYNRPAEKLALVKARPFLIGVTGFSIWLLISALLSDNAHSAGRVLELRLPLLILPFSLGTISVSRALRNKILTGAAIITATACLISVSYAIYQRIETGHNFWLYNDSVSYLTGQQSIYTSLLVNVSIFIFVWQILYSSYSVQAKGWMAFAIILLVIISYMLASRNMMLLLYAGILAFAFIYLFRRKKYLEGITLILALVIGGYLITKSFPNTLNRFRELTMTKFNYENQNRESHYDDSLSSQQWNGANFRLAAWSIGWQVFRQHPVTGTGIGDKRDELQRAYAEHNFHFAISTNKNVHNNYLDILFSTGLIGLCLYLAGWLLLPVISLTRKKDTLGLAIILTCAVAQITENYFDRTLGSMIFGFLVILLMTVDGQSTHHRFKHYHPDTSQ